MMINPVLSSKLLVFLLVVFTVFSLTENLEFAYAAPYDWYLINDIDILDNNLIRGISMNDDGKGIAVGEGGLILHTSDGGIKWIKGDIEGKAGNKLAGVSMSSNSNAVAVGAFGFIYFTTTGGDTWSKADTSKIRDSNPLYDVSMNGDNGIAVGAGTIMYTTNGGKNWNESLTWNEDNSNFTFGFSDRMFGVSMGSSGDAIAVGWPNLVFHTDDGGKNWTKSDPIKDKLSSIVKDPILRGVSMINSEDGVAVGNNGIIMYTGDGGDTWTWVDTNNIIATGQVNDANNNGQNIYKVSMHANGDIVVVGQNIIAYTFPLFNTFGTITDTEKNGGGCADCIPPTFGKNNDNIYQIILIYFNNLFYLSSIKPHLN